MSVRVTESLEVRTMKSGSIKKIGMAIHLAVLMHCILMGFLQVALCSTPFPQWEHFLPATELGCANSGDIQVSGPEPCQDPRWEGPAQYTVNCEMNSLKEVYHTNGCVLGVECNCF